MRQALYRTYRPVKFSEMVGQDHVRTILQNQIKAGEVGHAYLFTGPKGTGKTSVARIVARAVNCLNSKDGEPCGKCDMCQAFDNGQMMDLIEIDAASNRGIDNVRELISKVSLVPSMGKYKVYVIDEAHQLTKEAANALLKTLEEPPSHAIFILATTEADKLPPTIVSRCQRFDFRYLKTSEIADWLTEVAKQEKINIDKEALEFIAQQASGGMRDALSWLDQARMLSDHVTKAQIAEGFGFVDFSEVTALTELIGSGKAGEAVKKLNELYANGFDLGRLTVAWGGVVRNLLAIKLGGADLADVTEDQKKNLSQLVEKFDLNQLINFLELLMVASRDLKTAVIPQLPLEIVIVKMAEGKLEIKNEELKKEEPQKPQQPPQQVETADEILIATSEVPIVKSQAMEWPEEVSGLWSKVLSAVRMSSPTLGGLLALAEPDFAVTGLILKFPKDFHKQKMEEIKSMDLIKSALEDSGFPCKVMCVVDMEKTKDVRPVDLNSIAEVFEV